MGSWVSGIASVWPQIALAMLFLRGGKLPILPAILALFFNISIAAIKQTLSP